MYPLLLFLALLMALAPIPVAAATLSAAEQRALCQQRPRCQVEQVYSAGKTTSGAALRVIKLVLGLSEEEQKETEEDFTKGCRTSESDKKNGGKEYWLLEEKQPPHKIVALCNDGYGASGVGEDIVTIRDNRFTHTQVGGSASRWESTIIVSLSPPHLLASRGCNYHTLNSTEGEVHWETYTPLMTYALVKDRTFPKLEEKVGTDCPEKLAHWQWKTNPAPGLLAATPIPRPMNAVNNQGLDIKPGSTLGSCGINMSLNGSPGFLVFGKEDPYRTGYVRALVPNDNTLVVQIYDSQTEDHSSTNWVHRNHLEIWTAGDLDIGETVRPPAKKAIQIGITLDGKVYRGVGEAPFPTVVAWSATDEQNHSVRVLKLRWQQEYTLSSGFLLAYSQAEAGKQVRMVANAGVTRNRPDYLPTDKPLPARCQIENGRVNLIEAVELPLTGQ